MSRKTPRRWQWKKSPVGKQEVCEIVNWWWISAHLLSLKAAAQLAQPGGAFLGKDPESIQIWKLRVPAMQQDGMRIWNTKTVETV